MTGGTGLLGRHAVSELIGRGYEVHTAGRQGQVAHADVIAHKMDFMDHVSIRKVLWEVRPSHLLHCAWTTEHGAYWNSAANLDWMAGTLLLARNFAEAGGRRLVAIGTCAEYDWNAAALKSGPCDELSSRLEPHTFYGVIKDETRRTLEAYTALADISFAWARVFFPFGPGEDGRRLIPSIAERILRNETAPCTMGTQVRDFMAAVDVGQAMAAIVDCDVRGPINIGSGKPETIANIARHIAEYLGRPDLLALGALELRPDDPPCLVAKVERLHEEVRFEPQCSLMDRLDAYLEMIRSRPPV